MEDHTFIICAYKESAYLELCIQSLKQQSIKSEVILVTSTPNKFISDVSKKYGISIFVNENSSGIGSDWNFGLKSTKTKYRTLAHQDDVYMSTYTETLLEQLKKHEDALIAFSNYCELRNDVVVKNNRNLKIKKKLLFPLRINSKARFIKKYTIAFGNPICCPAVTYNMDKLGDFEFNKDFKTNLDWDAWARMAEQDGRFLYISKALMLHRIHEESETSNTIENNERCKEDRLMLKYFWPDKIAEILFKWYTKSEESNDVN